jgi:predicted DNA-binding WGR domain protein
MQIRDEHLAKLLLVYAAEGTTLVCTDGSHYKFWNAKYDTDTHMLKTTWGRIGNKTQSSEKNCSLYDYKKKIDEKLKKGYEYLE